MFETKNMKYWLITIIFLCLIVAVLAIAYLKYSATGGKPVGIMPEPVSEPVSDSIVPTNTKSPEDFMEKVQEKSESMQKNYDTNLTEFAQKKWERFFQEKNGKSSNYELKVLLSEIQKTSDGSTLFKVKYRIKQNSAENEMEDFYYMILSDAKKSELGVTNLKANAFLSEEDIRKYLGQENFAKIGKIN